MVVDVLMMCYSSSNIGRCLEEILAVAGSTTTNSVDALFYSVSILRSSW